MPLKPEIHDRFVKALEHRCGQVLSTNEIEKAILSKFPDTNLTSIFPNDHGTGNKSCCWCASTDKRIFDRIRKGTGGKEGLYKVRLALHLKVAE
ncbi:MAG: hypothetical protein AAB037_04485 [Chloroflexota bacterium]